MVTPCQVKTENLSIANPLSPIQVESSHTAICGAGGVPITLKVPVSPYAYDVVWKAKPE